MAEKDRVLALLAKAMVDTQEAHRIERNEQYTKDGRTEWVSNSIDYPLDELTDPESMASVLSEFNLGKSEDGTIVFDDYDYVGGEGDGADLQHVIKVTENPGSNAEKSTYLSFSGYYSSWDCDQINEFDIVKPYEVQVTRYAKVV